MKQPTYEILSLQSMGDGDFFVTYEHNDAIYTFTIPTRGFPSEKRLKQCILEDIARGNDPDYDTDDLR